MAVSRNTGSFVEWDKMETADLARLLDNLMGTLMGAIDDCVDNGPKGKGGLGGMFYLVWPTIQDITLVLLDRKVKVFQRYPVLLEINLIESQMTPGK